MSTTTADTPTGTTGLDRVAAIARKEFVHGVRSRTLQVLLAALLGTTALVFWAAERLADPSLSPVGLLGLPLQLLVPVAAILIGSAAVSGERESGSLRLLLGMPPSRTEVVLGKLLGGASVLVAGLAVTFGWALLVSRLTVGSVPVGPLVGVAIATVLLGGAFLGLSIGVSSAVSTAKRSLAATFGAFLGVTFLWEPLVAGVYYLVSGSLPGAEVPGWLLFLDRSNPIEAYAIASNMLGAAGVSSLRVSIGLLGTNPSAGVAERIGQTVPVYLTDPVSVVVLVGWLVVPVVAGLARFRRADL
ncbi:ABC transporter permease [Halohasta litorea]|uniref:ABC transporter permease n=1 Tax=Halohasta litorea TaxID=869891 RepID=A0ABD6D8M2_9EURY|nr:ABC transporter permease subunit [Halohasta litorea]